MVQKQLLLPVFLAGCETTDEKLRQEAREYCAWWNERTRYGMFDTANTLMEEAWADDRAGTWWGSDRSEERVGSRWETVSLWLSLGSYLGQLYYGTTMGSQSGSWSRTSTGLAH